MGANVNKMATSDDGQLIAMTLWEIFDLLRGEISFPDFHVATALLYLQHEGLLDGLGEGEPEGIKKELNTRISRLHGDDPAKHIYSAFESVIDKFNDHRFRHLVMLMNRLAGDRFRHSYAQWIEASVAAIANNSGKATSLGTLPIELSRALIKLADLPQWASVYNPFGGLATFGLNLSDGDTYYGEELNEQAAAIGLVRLLAQGRSGTIRYDKGDSINRWNTANEKYDLIIANPPWNLRMGEGAKGGRSLRYVESYFIQRALEDLKPNGKAIAVVPLGFLFKKDQWNTVEKLLDKGLLETVISFPGGLLKNTGIPFAVLLINKSKQRREFIRFVQADKFTLDGGGRDKRIDDQGLLSAIKDGTNATAVRWVPLAEIKANENNLNPARYFGSEEVASIEDGVQLGTIITYWVPPRAIAGAVAPFIRVRDLKEDPLDFKLQVEQLKQVEVPAHARFLNHSALLLAKRWSNLKPTWFEFSGTPIAITSDIFVLAVDENKVYLPYLISELLRPYVRDQVARLSRGVTVPNLRKEDVLGVFIELPSLAAQRAKVNGLEQAHVAAQVLQAQEAAKRHGVQLQQFGNAVSFKHRLSTPLLSVGSGIDTIRISLDGIQPDWRDHVVSAREQLTLGGIMDNVAYELQRISAMLEADSLELEVTKYPLEPMDLVTYAKKFVHRLQGELNGGHVVSFNISADIKEQLKGKATILGNRELLDTAMHALVDNAKRHGFAQAKGPHQLDISVSLRMEEHQAWLVLSVANSGKPFPKGFGLERYVRKNVHAGPTGHTGIGGYHVQEIMQHHKGMLGLITDRRPLGASATEIELHFPLSL